MNVLQQATTTAWPSMMRQEFDWPTLTSAGQTTSLVMTSARIALEPVCRLPSQFAMLIGMFISLCCKRHWDHFLRLLAA